jgi:hypothetical protein
VRLLPDAVVKRDYLDVADLVFLESRLRRHGLRLSGADERDALIESESGVSCGRAEHDVAA